MNIKHMHKINQSKKTQFKVQNNYMSTDITWYTAGLILDKILRFDIFMSQGLIQI